MVNLKLLASAFAQLLKGNSKILGSVQRTCGVEQFATRLAREYVTVYVQDETEDASA